MELSDPYFMSASLILVTRASKVEKLADLAGRRIAVVRSSIQQRDVGNVQPGASLVEVESVADGTRAVKGGQVDAFVYDDVVVFRIAQVDPELRVTGLPIRARPYAVAARKNDTGLIRCERLAGQDTPGRQLRGSVAPLLRTVRIPARRQLSGGQ